MVKVLKRCDLAIIIPVLNCLPYTKQMLPTIKTEYPYNLILIDNGSTDGTREFFNELGRDENIYPVHFSENKGVCPSWNFGIKFAIDKFDSQYFFIPNNDVLLNPGAIDILIEAIKTPKVVLTTATDVSGRVSASVEVLGLLPPVKSQFVEAPDFSCFLVKKETIKKIGYFDEKFYPAYFEDNDYHYRIKLAGLRAVRVNRALYFHYGSRTIKTDERMKEISNLGYTANREYYRQKWGGIPGEEKYKISFNKP